VGNEWRDGIEGGVPLHESRFDLFVDDGRLEVESGHRRESVDVNHLQSIAGGATKESDEDIFSTT